uniref:pectinesterase n=1 Tax=Tanacetum cinerariifolium TaxID=118510 RepID=A0A6L2NA76_TANCI|nr:probable pectinesterase/pectinesterase inhibitor 61 [Tanacetum cinerariifolium]
MNYGRLNPKSQHKPEHESTSDQPNNPNPKSKSKLKLLFTVAFILIVAAAVSVTLAVTLRPKSSGGSGSSIHKPTKAISRVCSRTLYQNLCVNSLVEFPGSLIASEKELVHISVNVTLQRVGKAYDTSTDINNLAMDTRVRSAYSDCLELLDDSVDQLRSSLMSVAPSALSESSAAGSSDDIITWLSASLTNHDTCTEGLSEAEDGEVKNLMKDKLKDLSELVSNSLAIYSSANDDNEFGDAPIQNKRRRLMSDNEQSSDFPKWVSKKERRLMDTPASAIQADVVVSKDGNATCKTIKEAIKLAPQKSSRRFIIYVKAGR